MSLSLAQWSCVVVVWNARHEIKTNSPNVRDHHMMTEGQSARRQEGRKCIWIADTLFCRTILVISAAWIPQAWLFPKIDQNRSSAKAISLIGAVTAMSLVLMLWLYGMRATEPIKTKAEAARGESIVIT